MPVSVPVSATTPDEVPSPPLRRPQHPVMMPQPKDRRHSSSPMQMMGMLIACFCNLILCRLLVAILDRHRSLQISDKFEEREDSSEILDRL